MRRYERDAPAPARSPNRRPPPLRTGSCVGDAPSPRESIQSRRRRRSQEPRPRSRSRSGSVTSRSGARSLSPQRTTLSQRRRSSSNGDLATKDDTELPAIDFQPPTLQTSSWRDLLAFAWSEALGDRHAFGLDENVTSEIDNFLLVPARFERFLWFGLLALFTLLIIGSVFYLLGYSDIGEDIVE